MSRCTPDGHGETMEVVDVVQVAGRHCVVRKYMPGA